MLRLENQSLLPRYVERIEPDSTRQAFFLLVGAGASSDVFECDAKEKGFILDFRYYSKDGKQPFAFIINKRSTLFYLRKPAVSSGQYDIDELRIKFPSISENNSGEWTIAVVSVQDAQRIAQDVLGKWQ